ncbi:uncharacterized protein LY79DRAFT_547857 [Colletotrichum navitas]|uniref:Uncharacterized protein n=1 Tax=Colletotrichum navitas TaxID=681940 RepID=A0AAD8Q4Q3_9PEZI|nr:uncharacterized protein LY79DRAFT_547857 [Colletotrichum navitas]KAK1595032.1 hypothetical protein LY79DRAFT_547857 [Colletotrichum navitas]
MQPAPPPRPQHCRRLLLLLLLLGGSLLLAVHYVACLRFCLSTASLGEGGPPQLRGRTFLRGLWNMGINQKCETDDAAQPKPAGGPDRALRTGCHTSQISATTRATDAQGRTRHGDADSSKSQVHHRQKQPGLESQAKPSQALSASVFPSLSVLSGL